MTTTDPTNTKRMLIDITTVETTKALAVAEVRRTVIMGTTCKLVGTKTTGYPVELWAFKRLDKLTLQYLLWNTFQEAPPEDFDTLAEKCLELVDKMVEDTTPLKELDKTYNSVKASVAVEVSETAQTKKKTMAPPKEPGRPKTGSTTGAVWDICDEQSQKLGREVDRKSAIDACVAEGINKATASTQFGKWRNFMASKNIENKA